MPSYSTAIVVERLLVPKKGKLDQQLKESAVRKFKVSRQQLVRYFRGQFVHRHKRSVSRQHAMSNKPLVSTVKLDNCYPTGFGGETIMVPSDAVLTTTLSFSVAGSK